MSALFAISMQTVPKTSLADALAGDAGKSSQISLSSSYQVPSTSGRLVQAAPQKFCLKYDPPTIAVLYTLDKVN